MSETTPFEVTLSVPLGKPGKTIEFDFHPEGSHPSPFDVAEFPSLRKQLREEVRERVLMTDDTLEEWETRLHSDRQGERLTVTLGTVTLDNETGDVVEWNLRITSPDDVTWS